MSHRVVITGLGCVSSLGVGCGQFWRGLTSGQSAIREVVVAQAGLSARFPAAPVTHYDPAEHFSADDLPRRDPFAQYAVVAAREAMADAGLTAGDGDPAQTGVVLGSGGGGEQSREEAAVRLFAERKLRCNPLLVPKTNNQAAVGFISMEFGLMGPSFVVSTGCAAASHAIAQAFLLVRHGVAERIVTGGSEAAVLLSVCQAFDAARVLTHTICRPFSRDRDGMAIGAGSGILVLERLEGARRRGASIYAELMGVGMSADASSSVHPAARGPALAISTALADAGWEAGCVDYINAHGTGTKVNDRVETESIKAALGEQAKRVAISSTKSIHGHAFGGAGGLELIATLLAMRHQVLPPTVNFLGPDDGCDLDYVPNEARPARVEHALKQSFAFGGLNVVLAVRRAISLP